MFRCLVSGSCPSTTQSWWPHNGTWEKIHFHFVKNKNKCISKCNSYWSCIFINKVPCGGIMNYTTTWRRRRVLMRRIYELHPPEEDAEWDPGILLPSCGRIMNYSHLKKTQNGKRILWIKALVFYCLHAADIWTKPTRKRRRVDRGSSGSGPWYFTAFMRLIYELYR